MPHGLSHWDSLRAKHGLAPLAKAGHKRGRGDSGSGSGSDSDNDDGRGHDRSRSRHEGKAAEAGSGGTGRLAAWNAKRVAYGLKPLGGGSWGVMSSSRSRRDGGGRGRSRRDDRRRRRDSDSDSDSDSSDSSSGSDSSSSDDEEPEAEEDFEEEERRAMAAAAAAEAEGRDGDGQAAAADGEEAPPRIDWERITHLNPELGKTAPDAKTYIPKEVVKEEPTVDADGIDWARIKAMAEQEKLGAPAGTAPPAVAAEERVAPPPPLPERQSAGGYGTQSMDPYAPGGRLYQGPPPTDGAQPDGAFPMAPLPPPPPLVFPGAPPLQGAGSYGTQSLDPYAPGGRLYQPPAAEPHAAALAAAPNVRFDERSNAAAADDSGYTSDPEPDEFAPADTFAGVRAGYAFKMGALGPGYYLDNRGAAAEAMRKAREEAAAARMATLYPPAPPVPAAKQVDPSVALGKIQKCLANPKKASKSASLMLKLAEAQLNADTAPLFITALGALMLDPALVDATANPGGLRDVTTIGDRGTRTAYAALFAAMVARSEVFAEADREKLETWSLQGGATCELLTDDTYQYAKAMRRVREAIEALPAGETNRTAEAAARRHAILSCLDAAWVKHAMPWAKVEIERCFLKAAEKRLLFTPAAEGAAAAVAVAEEEEDRSQRGRLDALTDKMRKGERKAIVNRTIRKKNANAHPLRNVGYSRLR